MPNVEPWFAFTELRVRITPDRRNHLAGPVAGRKARRRTREIEKVGRIGGAGCRPTARIFRLKGRGSLCAFLQPFSCRPYTSRPVCKCLARRHPRLTGDPEREGDAYRRRLYLPGRWTTCAQAARLRVEHHADGDEAVGHGDQSSAAAYERRSSYLCHGTRSLKNPTVRAVLEVVRAA